MCSLTSTPSAPQMSVALLVSRVRSGSFSAADFAAWAELFWATLEPGEAAMAALRTALRGIAWLPAESGHFAAGDRDDPPLVILGSSASARVTAAIAQLNARHTWLGVLSSGATAAAAASPRVARILSALGVREATVSGELASVAANIFARGGMPPGAPPDAAPDESAVVAAALLALEFFVELGSSAEVHDEGVTSEVLLGPPGVSSMGDRIRFLACFVTDGGSIVRVGDDSDEASAVALAAPGYRSLPRCWLHLPASVLPAGVSEVVGVLAASLADVEPCRSRSSSAPLWRTVSGPYLRSSRSEQRTPTSLGRRERAAWSALGVGETFSGLPCRTSIERGADRLVLRRHLVAPIRGASVDEGRRVCPELFVIVDELCVLHSVHPSLTALALRAVAGMLRAQLDVRGTAGTAIASTLSRMHWLPPTLHVHDDRASKMPPLSCPAELAAPWLQDFLGNRASYAPPELLGPGAATSSARVLAEALLISTEPTSALAAAALTAAAAAAATRIGSKTLESLAPNMGAPRTVRRISDAEQDASEIGCPTAAAEATAVVDVRLLSRLYAGLDEIEVARLGDALPIFIPHRPHDASKRDQGDSDDVIGRFATLGDGLLVHDDGAKGCLAAAGLAVTWDPMVASLHGGKNSAVVRAVREWSHTGGGEMRAFCAALDRVEAWGVVSTRSDNSAAKSYFGCFLAAMLDAMTAKKPDGRSAVAPDADDAGYVDAPRARKCVKYSHVGSLPFLLPVSRLTQVAATTASSAEDPVKVLSLPPSLLRVCDSIPDENASPVFLLDDDPASSAAAAQYFAHSAPRTPVYLIRVSDLSAGDPRARRALADALSVVPGVMAFSGRHLQRGVPQPGMLDFASQISAGSRRAWALACWLLQTTLREKHVTVYGQDGCGPAGVRDALLSPAARSECFVFVPPKLLTVAHEAIHPTSGARLVVFTEPATSCLLFGRHAHGAPATLYVDAGALASPSAAWCGAAIDAIMQCLGGDTSDADDPSSNAFNLESKQMRVMRAHLERELAERLPPLLAAPTAPVAANVDPEAAWFLLDDLCLAPPCARETAAAVEAAFISDPLTSLSDAADLLNALAEATAPPLELGDAASESELDALEVGPCRLLRDIADAEASRLEKLREKYPSRGFSERIGQFPGFVTSAWGAAGGSTPIGDGMRPSGKGASLGKAAAHGGAVDSVASASDRGIPKTTASLMGQCDDGMAVALPPDSRAIALLDEGRVAVGNILPSSQRVSASRAPGDLDTFGLVAAARRAVHKISTQSGATAAVGRGIARGVAAWGSGSDEPDADDEPPPAASSSGAWLPGTEAPPLEVALEDPTSVALATKAAKSATEGASLEPSAASLATGRAGESLVHELLAAECTRINDAAVAAAVAAGEPPPPLLVAVWENETVESERPFDVRVELGGAHATTVLYVEVKTTRAPCPVPGAPPARFHMSVAEASWAFRHSSRYELALVVGLGNPETVQVFRVRGSPRLPLLFELCSGGSSGGVDEVRGLSADDATAGQIDAASRHTTADIDDVRSDTVDEAPCANMVVSPLTPEAMPAPSGEVLGAGAVAIAAIDLDAPSLVDSLRREPEAPPSCETELVGHVACGSGGVGSLSDDCRLLDAVLVQLRKHAAVSLASRIGTDIVAKAILKDRDGNLDSASASSSIAQLSHSIVSLAQESNGRVLVTTMLHAPRGAHRDSEREVMSLAHRFVLDATLSALQARGAISPQTEMDANGVIGGSLLHPTSTLMAPGAAFVRSQLPVGGRAMADLLVSLAPLSGGRLVARHRLHTRGLVTPVAGTAAADNATSLVTCTQGLGVYASCDFEHGVASSNATSPGPAKNCTSHIATEILTAGECGVVSTQAASNAASVTANASVGASLRDSCTPRHLFAQFISLCCRQTPSCLIEWLLS